MLLCISERAASDCVQLGINVNDVQRAVTRRNAKKVRLSDGRRVKVILSKNVIWRVKPAFKIEPCAIDQANRIGVDCCRLMSILAHPRRPGGMHTAGDGIYAVVRPVPGGEIVVSVLDRRSAVALN